MPTANGVTETGTATAPALDSVIANGAANVAGVAGVGNDITSPLLLLFHFNCLRGFYPPPKNDTSAPSPTTDLNVSIIC